jgi:MFS family permease
VVDAGRGRLEATAEGAAERVRGDAAAELAASVAMANVGFYVAGIGVVLVVLADDLGVPAERLSWLGSAFGYGLFVVALAGPLLLSRLGQRGVLIAAAAVLGAGSLLLAVVPGEATAYAGALLQGLGAAGIVLVAPRLLHGPDAAVKLTRVNAVGSIVSISAPVLLGVAATAGIGARLPLLLVTASMVVLVVLARRLPAHATVVADPAQPVPVLSRPLVVRRWLALVCSVSVEFAFVVWGVARLTGAGLEPGWAAVVAAMFQVGMALGRVVGPRLMARIPVVLVGSLVAGVGTLLVVIGEAWPLIGLGQLLAGFGIATLYPVTLARLMASPGLRPELGASFGAMGSATAITLMPTLLAALALVVDLRLAFLVPLPVLALLLWLHHERPATGA